MVMNSSELELPGGCEPPVDAGNWTWFFCRGSVIINN